MSARIVSSSAGAERKGRALDAPEQRDGGEADEAEQHEGGSGWPTNNPTSSDSTIPPAFPASHINAVTVPAAPPARRSLASRITGRSQSSSAPMGTSTITSAATSWITASASEPATAAAIEAPIRLTCAPRRATSGGSIPAVTAPARTVAARIVPAVSDEVP